MGWRKYRVSVHETMHLAEKILGRMRMGQTSMVMLRHDECTFTDDPEGALIVKGEEEKMPDGDVVFTFTLEKPEWPVDDDGLFLNPRCEAHDWPPLAVERMSEPGG